MKKMPRQSGFTIVELMVTLSIAAVLLALAAPNFSNMIADNRMSSATNNFISAIALARNVAITRKRNTSVTARSPGNNANEWGAGGWVVWSDDNGDGVQDAGGTEDVRFFEPVNDIVSVDGPDGAIAIVFNSSGLRPPGADPFTITICDSRTGETGRQITVGLTGRPSLERKFGCL